MKKDKRREWLLAGYSLFSIGGPKEIKIEVLARKVNKNKSSFYHYFANLEIFTEFLLQYHIERTREIVQKEQRCKRINPDLFDVLIEAKEDLFFNRQLRVNRSNARFRDCLDETNKIVGDSITEIWAEALGIKNNTPLARIVLKLGLENFYLQLTESTINKEWMTEYLNEFKTMTEEFQKSAGR